MDNEFIEYLVAHEDNTEEYDEIFLYNYKQNLRSKCNYRLITNNKLSSNENKKDEIIILHLNIQSIKNKYDRFKLFLQGLVQNNELPDIILLCETFLTNDIEHLFQIQGYNMETTNREDKKGGGVAILVRNNISYKIESIII